MTPEDAAAHDGVTLKVWADRAVRLHMLDYIHPTTPAALRNALVRYGFRTDVDIDGIWSQFYTGADSLRNLLRHYIL